MAHFWKWLISRWPILKNGPFLNAPFFENCQFLSSSFSKMAHFRWPIFEIMAHFFAFFSCASFFTKKGATKKVAKINTLRLDECRFIFSFWKAGLFLFEKPVEWILRVGLFFKKHGWVFQKHGWVDNFSFPCPPANFNFSHQLIFIFPPLTIFILHHRSIFIFPHQPIFIFPHRPIFISPTDQFSFSHTC